MTVHDDKPVLIVEQGDEETAKWSEYALEVPRSVDALNRRHPIVQATWPSLSPLSEAQLVIFYCRGGVGSRSYHKF